MFVNQAVNSYKFTSLLSVCYSKGSISTGTIYHIISHTATGYTSEPSLHHCNQLTPDTCKATVPSVNLVLQSQSSHFFSCAALSVQLRETVFTASTSQFHKHLTYATELSHLHGDPYPIQQHI